MLIVYCIIIALKVVVVDLKHYLLLIILRESIRLWPQYQVCLGS